LDRDLHELGARGGKKGRPRELERLKELVDRGRTATASVWPSIRTAFGWVHQVAHLLGNEPAESGGGVQRRLSGFLGAMACHRHRVGKLRAAVEHFRKVTRSYWPGLFPCCVGADLPRTNNDLEQFFGRPRYHERRASGRKGASPALVLRGAAQVVAAAATRRRVYTAKELAEVNRADWKQLRGKLETRRQRRTERTRFRRDPKAFLSKLEEQLLQPVLPT
jgi:hypothetical protein